VGVFGLENNLRRGFLFLIDGEGTKWSKWDHDCTFLGGQNRSVFRSVIVL
jgi:hypothetical protein